MDQFLNLQSDAFIFKGQLNDNSQNSFEKFLDQITLNFKLFNFFANQHVTILPKDIPPFVHFQVPQRALLKFYFRMKSMLHYGSFKGYSLTWTAHSTTTWDVATRVPSFFLQRQVRRVSVYL